MSTKLDWTEAYVQAQQSDLSDAVLPMVEIFETVEGEGTKAGYPTVFVRVFHCNLRCTWCDTPYSYAPANPEFHASVPDIAATVAQYGWQNICLTGGEPLIHRHKSQLLIDELARIPHVQDIHIETNGAIDIRPFARLREQSPELKQKVRFVVDFKLPSSGETAKMITEHLEELSENDELKFVIGTEEDFEVACNVLQKYHLRAIPLFSPVWETMPPDRLVKKILDAKLSAVKLNLQIHKVIWDPAARGV